MAGDNGNWQDLEQADNNNSERYDPLAELGTELALCILYLEEGKGSWCDNCSCTLKYHCTTDKGECEICGCYYLHINPLPVLIPSAPIGRVQEDRLYEPRGPAYEQQERSKEARKALKELTE